MQTLGDGGLDVKAGRLRLFPMHTLGDGGIDDSVTMRTLGDCGLDAKAGRLGASSPNTRWVTGASMTRSRCKRSAMAASTSKLADCAC
ncbi:hypothetical protein MRX96_059884 [Rhipicephalus microplus]